MKAVYKVAFIFYFASIVPKTLFYIGDGKVLEFLYLLNKKTILK